MSLATYVEIAVTFTFLTFYGNKCLVHGDISCLYLHCFSLLLNLYCHQVENSIIIDIM